MYHCHSYHHVVARLPVQKVQYCTKGCIFYECLIICNIVCASVIFTQREGLANTAQIPVSSATVSVISKGLSQVRVRCLVGRIPPELR